MRAGIALGILIAGPILGALLALAVGQGRAWQIIAGAVAAECLAYVGLRLWSARALRQHLAAAPDALLVSLPQQSWSEQVTAVLILLAFAAAVGGLVLLARVLVVRGR